MMRRARAALAGVALVLAAGAALASQYRNSDGSVTPGVVVEANPGAGIAPIATAGPAFVAKGSPGALYGYQATAGGSAAFVAVLNATAIPAAGAAITPLECSAVPANGTYRTRQDIPDRYTVGVVLLFTTSCSTYTAGAPALLGAVVQ
jgi:hypothetical protein